MHTPSGIVLAFDDGRSDNYYIWKELLNPQKIPATINITTAYNDGTQKPASSPTPMPPLGPERIAEIARSPWIEIGCHGKEHICDPKDAKEGELHLREWLGIKEGRKMGYACPNSAISIAALRSEEWGHFLYLRTGICIRNHAAVRIMIRKLNRFFHIPKWYEIAFAGSIMYECKDSILYSVPILQDTSVEEIIALVNRAVREEGHLILLFHSIGENGGAERTWTYSREKFVELTRRLQEMQRADKIKMMTTAQLYALLKK